MGPIKYKDLCVMAFGGLRGAIAFSLAFVLVDDKHVCVDGGDQPVQIFKHRDLFISTTIFMVLFTVIVQGSLVPDLLEALHTKREEEKHHSFIEKLTGTMCEHVREGISSIKSNKPWSLWWEHAFHKAGTMIRRLATRHHSNGHSNKFGYYAEELDKGHIAHAHEAFEKLNDAYWKARDLAPTLGLEVGTEEFEFFIADRLHQQMFEELEHFSKLDPPPPTSPSELDETKSAKKKMLEKEHDRCIRQTYSIKNRCSVPDSTITENGQSPPTRLRQSMYNFDQLAYQDDPDDAECADTSDMPGLKTEPQRSDSEIVMQFTRKWRQVAQYGTFDIISALSHVAAMYLNPARREILPQKKN